VEILNLGGAAESNSPAPKARKKLRVLLGIGALAAVTGIGSTLAPNISLNGGGNVEFGQGVATTAACDDDITLTPISEFSNTEEDATFAMTAIQISGIDLTPEGWDAESGNWISGFNLATYDVVTGYVPGYWDENMKEHAGQYLNENGDWTNTCDNKVLMLRAFTDNYPERTVNNNIDSPLYLTGYNSTRPLYYSGTNAGIGFRIKHESDNPYWDSSAYDLFNDDNYNNDFSPLYDWDYNYDGNYGNDSTVVMDLNGSSYYPPLDSRWIDKLTIESAADYPSSWNWD